MRYEAVGVCGSATSTLSKEEAVCLILILCASTASFDQDSYKVVVILTGKLFCYDKPSAAAQFVGTAAMVSGHSTAC